MHHLIKCRRSDHTVRTEQVMATYRSTSGIEVVVSGGSAEARDLYLATVLEVSYTMLPSKTKCFIPVVYTFELSDKRSKRLVTMT